jgi:HEAT repeat protein
VTPLQRTIDALAKSHNDAATPTLIAALGEDSGPIFDGAIAGLVTRRSKAGHLQVLNRWRALSPAQRELVEKGRSRMGGALREALLEGDDQLFEAAWDFVDESGDFDLLPTLVMVAEQPSGARSQKAIELTLRLIEQLSDWIASDRQPAVGRDPETIRLCVLESLERSVERFREHQRPELIEAFVVLAGPHSEALVRIVETPHHPCFPSVVQSLSASASPGVIRLLLDMLTTKDAPQIVRNVIAKRTDGPFAAALLAVPLDPKNTILRRNLARLRGVACCCEAVHDVCTALEPLEQAAAMRLLAATGAGDDQKLALAEALLRRGALEARIAACAALQPISGQRANKLVLLALKDDDPSVQAAAARQLRVRRIPGMLAKLIELAESPHEEVRAAAREALSEFSFDNFAARFDILDEDARCLLGGRVARIDPTALDRLRQELASSVRRQRLRAIDMVGAMGLVQPLADALIERLDDDDHLVRAAAAEALQACQAADVRKALLAAIGDRSAAVQMAARNSLRALASLPTADAATPLSAAEAAT